VGGDSQGQPQSLGGGFANSLGEIGHKKGGRKKGGALLGFLSIPDIRRVRIETLLQENKKAQKR